MKAKLIKESIQGINQIAETVWEGEVPDNEGQPPAAVVLDKTVYVFAFRFDTDYIFRAVPTAYIVTNKAEA